MSPTLATLSHTFSAMRLSVREAVATVVLDNPPLNLLDAALIGDLRRFAAAAMQDESVRVVVFESADREFFIAHGDARFVSEDGLFASLVRPEDGLLNPMEALHEAIRAIPQITIGKLAGIARGGGSELLMALDMRFAAIETAGLAQPEAALGILPGGGGSQYITRLAGRSRALEVILGGGLVDAVSAERYGLVNRALPSAQLDEFVEILAVRIGRLRPGVIEGVVRAVGAAGSSDIAAGLAVENAVLAELFTDGAKELTLDLLARGYQTRDVERDLEQFLQS